MHSNLDSPSHPINKFVNTALNTPIDDPIFNELPNTPVQTPSVDNTVPEQDKPPTPIQTETYTSPESQPQDPLITNTVSETVIPDPQFMETDFPIPSSPFHPSVGDEQFYSTLPVKLDEPVFFSILKAAIDIDDEIIPPNLNKIKVIQRKRPAQQPTIPFDPTKPFFNPISEPNLELIDIAISISLKKFKQIEEEALVFPSDVDAEVRELTFKFDQTLEILSSDIKRKIQGRGMAVVVEIFSKAENTEVPRLTNYNHEEKLLELKALEEANRKTSEERIYDEMIAADIERQIAAEIELQKEISQEIVMTDQNHNEDRSDKGKDPIIDTTPPPSPKVEPGSTSGVITPAVQQALDKIQTELVAEMRDEIDVLRVDLRSDITTSITASEEATHKKMDAMMQMLLNAIADIKKP
jgi:hypothetical protein